MLTHPMEYFNHLGLRVYLGFPHPILTSSWDFLPASNIISFTPSILSKKPILSLIHWRLNVKYRFLIRLFASFIHTFFISPLKFSHIFLFNLLIFINPWFVFINPCVLVVGIRHIFAIAVMSSTTTSTLFSCVLKVYRLTIRMFV